jgi:GNAT superfamily N-acetyltransferase
MIDKQAQDPGRPRRPAAGTPVRVSRGTMRDYDALAPFHYRSGRPATRVRILRAKAGPQLVGVLVVSMPTLNAGWRRSAWGDRYSSRPSAALARRLNREVRTISRVIVDPRWRGLGVASQLVRSYLRRPLSTRTEAIAVMGAYSPFFERAGMRRVSVPQAARDRTLARRLRQAGVRPLALLRERERAEALARRDVREAILKWARAHATYRRAARTAPIGDLAIKAASALIAAPVAFVFP